MLSTKELLSKFATPTSFKDIGRVTNGEMPRKPPLYFINANNTVYAPDMTFPSLKQHIEAILSQIEGLKYKWDEDNFIWKIEWGTCPMEYGKDYRIANTIKHGRFAAQIAACEAIKMFPHLINGDQDNEDLGLPIGQSGEWSKIELRAYWDSQQERVFLELNRMTGCHITFYNILEQFKARLGNV